MQPDCRLIIWDDLPDTFIQGFNIKVCPISTLVSSPVPYKQSHSYTGIIIVTFSVLAFYARQICPGL